MAKERHTEEELNINHLQRLYDTFRGESDRGAAIVGAAYPEARLAELISAFLTREATKSSGDLKWPLDTFGRSVDLAHWMGLTSDDEHHDLKKIGQVRNRFAHKGHDLSFSDPRVVAWCSELRLWKPLSEFLDLATARQQFLFTVTELLMQLGIRVLRARKQRRVTPDEFRIRQIVR
jgi:hypothetical protein